MHLKRAHLTAAENSLSLCARVGLHACFVSVCEREVQYVACAPMCARVRMLTECEMAIMGIMHSP